MWTNDVVLKLIELFQSKECLWDTSNNDYKNKNKKNYSWEDISNNLKIPRRDVESKIHNLRSQFIRERKKIKASKKTGSGTDVRKSNWFAYDSLLFLIKGETSSGDIDIMIEQKTSKDSQDSSQDSLDDQASDSQEDRNLNNKNKNKRPRPSDDKIDEAYEILLDAKRKINENSVKDDFDVYGQYVASELRKIKTENALIMTKYYINNIIMEARIGKYDTKTGDLYPYGTVSTPSQCGTSSGTAHYEDLNTSNSLQDRIEESDDFHLKKEI